MIKMIQVSQVNLFSCVNTQTVINYIFIERKKWSKFPKKKTQNIPSTPIYPRTNKQNN